MSNSKPVTANDVREWARGRGQEVAEHGRLSQTTIDAYNKAHRTRKYEATLHQPLKVVRLPKRTGGKLAGSVQTTYPQIRQWANKHGYELGSRGRIPADVLAAFANAA